MGELGEDTRSGALLAVGGDALRPGLMNEGRGSWPMALEEASFFPWRHFARDSPRFRGRSV